MTTALVDDSSRDIEFLYKDLSRYCQICQFGNNFSISVGFPLIFANHDILAFGG